MNWNACPTEDNARSGRLGNMNRRISGNLSHARSTNIHIINTRVTNQKRHINVMGILVVFDLMTPKRTAELRLLLKNAPWDAIPVLQVSFLASR